MEKFISFDHSDCCDRKIVPQEKKIIVSSCLYVSIFILGRSKLANTHILGSLHRTSSIYHVENTLRSPIYHLILFYDLATTSPEVS